jgi:basic amino acid/polyamine antiporter, APA family
MEIADGPPERSHHASSSSQSQHSTASTSLERHLTLVDLLAVGVGGTIGSGLFVLAGLVANQYAGPATVISWALSGSAALLSGCCYAELSSRLPETGGAYVYAKRGMGELAGVLTAACLSLEYLAAASAVARSWGDKVVEWLAFMLGSDHSAVQHLGGGGNDGTDAAPSTSSYGFSPLAFLIASATILLLLNGVHESKKATNVFTALKVSLVAFMTIVGFLHASPSNWTPFVPPTFGYGGIVRGATGTFFGYLGYDQVSCLGGEAIDPHKNLPRAILATIVGVAVVYMTATLALTGMLPYADISPVSGFPAAFYTIGLPVAGQISAVGEIVTLPIVVLISIMAQPRLQYALAQDGLAPAWLGQTDSSGNLWNGTLFAGILMITIATFVPFTHLNDVISCAVLMALSMTDTSLVLLWHSASTPNEDEDGLIYTYHSTLDEQDGEETGSSSQLSSYTGGAFVAEGLMLAFHLGAFITSVSITLFIDTNPGILAAVLGAGCMVLAVHGVATLCPRNRVFGGTKLKGSYYDDGGARPPNDPNESYFSIPTPYVPCLGIFVNWYLIAQLDWMGIVGLVSFLALSALYYYCYAAPSSRRKRATSDVEVELSSSRPSPRTTDESSSRRYSRGPPTFADGSAAESLSPDTSLERRQPSPRR